MRHTPEHSTAESRAQLRQAAEVSNGEATSCRPNGVNEHWNRRETTTLETIIWGQEVSS